MRRVPTLLLLAAVLVLGFGGRSARAGESWDSKSFEPREILPDDVVRASISERDRDVKVQGRVEGNIHVGKGSVDVLAEGVVTGNITVDAGDVRIHRGGRVDGDVKSLRGNVWRFPGGQVGGSITTPGRSGSGEAFPGFGGFPRPGQFPGGGFGRGWPPGSRRDRDRGPGGAPTSPTGPTPSPPAANPIPAWLRPASSAGLVVGILACLVLMQGLFPFRLERATTAAIVRPGLVSGVGTLTVLSAAALSGGIFLLSQSLAPALLPLAAVGVLASPGLAAVARILGHRVIPAGWRESSALAPTLAGALLWQATFLVPGVGWAIGLGILIWGLGAMLCSSGPNPRLAHFAGNVSPGPTSVTHWIPALPDPYREPPAD